MNAETGGGTGGAQAPDLGGYAIVQAPQATSRMIPSRFPPIATFDAVTTPDDLEAVMFLEGWTNDRLVAPRIQRLDKREWVFDRPNSSVVMAAFLHGSPGGLRFSDASLGAWYAASELKTAVLEVANGLRREIALSAVGRIYQTYRQYKARLGGGYIDIVGLHPEFHDPDDKTYPVPQAFGHKIRDLGPGAAIAGIRYGSVRHPGHDNWVCFRPPQIRDVMQAGHFGIDVPESGTVVVRHLG